jgi:coenzyme F420-reducing hydrogenase gamma subunit
VEKPKVGIYGLTSCAGDQLVILNCEHELLDIVGAVDIKSFPMAMTDNDDECSLDIVFVEGTVVQPKDEELLKKLRERSSFLIAIGTCAVWGGIPAAKNEIPRGKLQREVYSVEGEIFETVTPRPLSSFVKIDLAISGCPIEKQQLLQAIASLLRGDLPRLPNYPVCTECKIAEYSCLLVEQGQLCVGPITVAGCKARCPRYGQPCIGCQGPVEEANVSSEVTVLKEKGFTLVDIQNRLRTFAGPAEALKIESFQGATNA